MAGSSSKKEEEDLVSGTFTWKIDQFSNKNSSEYYSDVFVIGGFKWRISIFPKAREYLPIYMNVADSSLSRHAKFNLTVVNQLDRNKSITKGTKDFTEVKNWWGIKEFMLLREVSDLSKGYLLNDNVIVEAEVSVRKGDIKILEKETGELIDFKGLGRIELAFHPLLEEVCLLHPSLIQCQQKRSRTFVEWAFTTLGRLLHFLKTRKVKDLNQDDCYDSLKQKWEELETFKFDLAWLQPHVQAAFRMRNMADSVERMRQDVKNLENEKKTREDMLAATEFNLKRAKGVLVKAEEEFKLGHLDSVIGYPLA
ncbi:hypothetical protein M0R45_036251 [Rubus argutus]|uniref:MATH domain-containing protein n=1 Tax=Rubus argutus TaxID=59490 RepID=A0AAW1VVK0_RUBAR